MQCCGTRDPRSRIVVLEQYSRPAGVGSQNPTESVSKIELKEIFCLFLRELIIEFRRMYVKICDNFKLLQYCGIRYSYRLAKGKHNFKSKRLSHVTTYQSSATVKFKGPSKFFELLARVG